jgi:hypothetical protein
MMLLVGLIVGVVAGLGLGYWQWRRPFLRTTRGPTSAPAETVRAWVGSQPPNRYTVVRWPSGQRHYEGCVAKLARETFEHNHPARGEEVELWELGNRRGHKQG